MGHTHNSGVTKGPADPAVLRGAPNRYLNMGQF